ncbi:hypothetical protein Pint_15669 [Pistacia integerrima]|uniref:Uncharacterized protein n=1 Tax=Pistacia integerrima TaxID=434235 RepID=A0ACC0ZAU2_9ROSI|nr:hypothetical protein Pint_15669 [Pistacia integerrima]
MFLVLSFHHMFMPISLIFVIFYPLNFQSELHSGSLLKFAIGDGGLSFVDGKLEKADLHYLGKTNRARMFADSYSKVIFQYMVRHAPLKFDDLLASFSSSNDQENKLDDVEMVG